MASASSRCIGLLALCWALVGAASAAEPAQQSPENPPQTAATAPATDEGLSEIIVTARFKSENLQTAPIAITAVSGVTNLRQIQVTITYQAGKFQRSYTLTTNISNFS